MNAEHRARAGSGLALVCSAVLAMLLGAMPAAGQGLPVVSPAVANQHIVKRVAPAYPAVAREAQIQGIVVFGITVGQTGKVTHVTFVGGPPLLAYAASEAVKQWRFKPFLVNGKPAEIDTVVHVFFLLGSGKKQVDREERESLAYFDALGRCRSSLAAQRYADTAQACSNLRELAAELPDKGYWEQAETSRCAGLLALQQGNYSESVTLLRRAITLASTTQTMRGPDMGRAYEGLAAAYEKLGRPKKAASAYKRAISNYRRAEGDRHSTFGQDWNGNMTSLETLLRQYATVLRKLGKAKDAAEATREADKLASKIHK